MKKKIMIKPDMGWQVKEYSRIQDFHFTLPYQFLLLCKLLDTPPQRLLIDFMDNLSCGSWKRKGRDRAKEKLIEYFLEHGYGQDYYTPVDLREIIREMDAVGESNCIFRRHSNERTRSKILLIQNILYKVFGVKENRLAVSVVDLRKCFFAALLEMGNQYRFIMVSRGWQAGLN